MEMISGFTNIFATVSFNTLNTSIICEYNALIALALEDQHISEDL
jgi:hypothetical protein